MYVIASDITYWSILHYFEKLSHNTDRISKEKLLYNLFQDQYELLNWIEKQSDHLMISLQIIDF